MNNSRKNYKKMVEIIVRLYHEGNANQVYFRASNGVEPVWFAFAYIDDCLYIEETDIDDIVIGSWLLDPKEVTIGGVFHRIYPRKGRWYSNEYYRHKVSGNHPRLHRGRGDN